MKLVYSNPGKRFSFKTVQATFLGCNLPTTFLCCSIVSTQHCTSCKKGGFAYIIYNDLRDFPAKILSEV